MVHVLDDAVLYLLVLAIIALSFVAIIAMHYFKYHPTLVMILENHSQSCYVLKCIEKHFVIMFYAYVHVVIVIYLS